MNPNLPFSELVAAFDAKTIELEEARVRAEAAWAEYEVRAAEVVKLTNRWGVAIRRYKELAPEQVPALEPAGLWAWLKRLFGV